MCIPGIRTIKFYSSSTNTSFFCFTVEDCKYGWSLTVINRIKSRVPYLLRECDCKTAVLHHFDFLLPQLIHRRAGRPFYSPKCDGTVSTGFTLLFYTYIHPLDHRFLDGSMNHLLKLQTGTTTVLQKVDRKSK